MYRYRANLFPYDEDVQREINDLNKKSERRAQAKAAKKQHTRLILGRLYMSAVLLFCVMALTAITIKAVIPTVISVSRFADGVVSAEYPDGKIRISTYYNYIVGNTIYRTYTPVYDKNDLSYNVIVGSLK